MIVSINAPKAIVEEEPILAEGEEGEEAESSEEDADEDSSEESE
jgi:hypothetical protein